jgi:hypothetical protein
MTDSSELVLAHHARTPTEATLLAGRLQAEGIRAFVEGSIPTDEVAMSRQLMNTGGVRILVPASQLEAARALLDEEPVSEEQLEAAALAEGEAWQPRRADPSAPLGWVLLAVLAVAAAILFLILWLDARSYIRSEHPLYEWRYYPTRLDSIWRANGELAERLTDANRNGIFEAGESCDHQGLRVEVWTDADEDGAAERAVAVAPDGSETVFEDLDGDQRWDRIRVERDGRVLQRFAFEAGRGWVETDR